MQEPGPSVLVANDEPADPAAGHESPRSQPDPGVRTARPIINVAFLWCDCDGAIANPDATTPQYSPSTCPSRMTISVTAASSTV